MNSKVKYEEVGRLYELVTFCVGKHRVTDPPRPGIATYCVFVRLIIQNDPFICDNGKLTYFVLNFSCN